MADDIDEDLIVTLDDVKDLGTPKKPEPGDDGTKAAVEKVADTDAGKEKPLTAEEGKEDLAAQLKAMSETAEAERVKRQQAEREADEAKKVADTARKDVVTREEQIVTSAIETVNSQRAQAKKDYAAAMEAADWGAAADAQEAMALSASRLTQLEAAKATIDARKVTPRPAHEGRVEKPAAAQDAFEQAISGLEPPAQAWARLHPECFTDAKLYNRMLAAHYGALDEDIKPNTRAYFDHLETKLGFRTASDAKADDPKPAQRGNPRPSAPPNRDTGHGGGPRVQGNTVTLSAVEREHARIAGLTDVQYARHLADLEREGELGKYARR